MNMNDGCFAKYLYIPTHLSLQFSKFGPREGDEIQTQKLKHPYRTKDWAEQSCLRRNAVHPGVRKREDFTEFQKNTDSKGE